MKTKGDIDAYLGALFKREAGGVDHTKVNRAGYIGKYQFGEPALIDLGYYTADGTNKNDWSGKWKGKNGINSRGDFLNDAAAQDTAAKEWVALLCKRLRIYKLATYIGKTINGIEITDSGIIAGAHLKGFGSEKHPGVRQFLKSNGDVDPKDGLGTPVSHYVELFAGYDVGCCKQACLAFAEKKTGAPISGMKVQIKKNGKVHKTVRTDKNGLINTPFAFSPGDAIEVLVEKIAGGYKSLKTAIMDDANLILAFVSPKAKAVVTTEVHKGTPKPRATTTKSPPPPPKATASVSADATSAASAVPTPSTSTDKNTITAVEGESTVNTTTTIASAQTTADTTSPENATFDQLDALEKVWQRMSSYQTQDVLAGDNSTENQPAGSGVAKVAEAEDQKSAKSASEQKTDIAQQSNVAPSPVEKTRNTKGHPVAAVKKKEQPPAPKIVAPMQKVIPGLLFPLEKKPGKSYKTDARRFGSNRDNGRKHAGIDLYAPKGTPIRAMADGQVIWSYYFYDGTYVIEIDHGTFIARYGEVDRRSILVKPNDEVKRGQKIAAIGKLVKLKKTMLHLEMYGSTDSPRKAGHALTQKENKPFQRRNDLIDPTNSIDQATME